MKHPADLTHSVITRVIDRGSSKDGNEDEWQGRHAGYHLTRAIRHSITALMMYMGWQSLDDEGVRGHMENAITRLSMAYWKMMLN